MKTRRVFALAVLAIAMILPLLQPARAEAATSGDFVSRVNALRSSKDLGTLSVNGSLAAQAQRWAESMAAANKISHNPALSSTPGDWTKVGENVGTGGDVQAIFDALVASPGHYRNMVDTSFNSIGVGVAIGSDGRIYTCHVFASFPGVKSTSTQANTSAPAAKSEPTTAAPQRRTTSTPAPRKAATAPSTTKAPSTTAAPQAPATAPAPAAQPAPVAAPAPALPTPNALIVQGLAEVGSIATQG